MNLTGINTMTNLPAPRNIEVGFSSSNYKGDNTPIIKSVFLCLPFLDKLRFKVLILLLHKKMERKNQQLTVTAINSIMTALFWRPFRSVVPLYDTANQFNAVTRFLAVLRDGFTPLNKGITA